MLEELHAKLWPLRTAKSPFTQRVKGAQVRIAGGCAREGRFAGQAEQLLLCRSIATMTKAAPLPRLRDQKPTRAKASAPARQWDLNRLADRLAELEQSLDPKINLNPFCVALGIFQQVPPPRPSPPGQRGHPIIQLVKRSTNTGCRRITRGFHRQSVMEPIPLALAVVLHPAATHGSVELAIAPLPTISPHAGGAGHDRGREEREPEFLGRECQDPRAGTRLAIIVRIFFYQPFNIPSGSMKETLLVGDYLFVSKLSYGYSRYTFPWEIFPFQGRIFSGEPKRGDVVVFKLPRDNSTDYIKRVIGLPGDNVVVRSGIVYINGQAAPQVPAGQYDGPEESRPKPRYEETLPNGVTHYVLHWERQGDLDNAGPFDIPQGQYFMMGDNRDNSIDSRVSPSQGGVGYVPAQNLVGRAEILFFSVATDDPQAFRLTRPWTWPLGIRWTRFFRLVR